jgi:hypothetical protein
MHGNRVPVYRVAVREFAREDTEEREHYGTVAICRILLSPMPTEGQLCSSTHRE